MSGEEEARRQTRAETDQIVRIERRGDAHKGRLLDIAMTGARVACKTRLREGDRVVFRSVRMGERPAEVVWSEKGVLGLRFTDDAASEAERRGQPPAKHWLSALRGQA